MYPIVTVYSFFPFQSPGQRAHTINVFVVFDSLDVFIYRIASFELKRCLENAHIIFFRSLIFSGDSNLFGDVILHCLIFLESGLYRFFLVEV